MRHVLSRIESFSGQYRFLSNFWPVHILYEGIVYPSAEHAYQAAKSSDPDERQRVANIRTASLAKQYGKYIHVRSDFDRLAVMRDIIRIKFAKPWFKQALLETGDAELIEGNFWNDTFWGRSKGTGANHLGRILMEVRDGARTI